MIKLYIGNTAVLKNSAVFEQRLRLLPPGQQEKISALRTVSSRTLSLGGLLLLRTALSEIGIQDFAIRQSPFGKPHLENHSDVFFNISHSGEYAVCAVGGCEMGTDIEKIRDVNLRVAKRFFSKSECAALDAQEDSLKKETFFRIWTLKESFVKAVGTGMHTALNSFSVALEPQGTGQTPVCQVINGKKYFFQEYPLAGYKMAVCSETGDLCSRFLNIEL